MWDQFTALKQRAYTRKARIRLYEDSRADFERFLRQNPDHADADTASWHVIQILLLGNLDDVVQQKIKAFRKRYPKSAHLPSILMEVANVLLRINDEKGALAALRDFLANHGDDGRAYGARMKLGIVQRNLAMYEAAEETFRAIRKNHPDTPGSWGAILHLAITQQADDRTTQACRTLEGILRDSDDEGARQTAGYYLSQFHRIELKEKIPAFEGKDAFGTTTSRKAFRDRVGVIYFFDPTRNMAAQEAEFVRKLAITFKKQDVRILGVCVAPMRQRFHNFRQAHQPAWTMYFEGEKLDGQITRGFEVRGLPALHVIDRHGTLRHFNLSGRDLENAIHKLLKEK